MHNAPLMRSAQLLGQNSAISRFVPPNLSSSKSMPQSFRLRCVSAGEVEPTSIDCQALWRPPQREERANIKAEPFALYTATQFAEKTFRKIAFRSGSLVRSISFQIQLVSDESARPHRQTSSGCRAFRSGIRR